MSYKEKLRELLKTDDQVKEQMENLEFWCSFKTQKCSEIIIHYIIDNNIYWVWYKKPFSKNEIEIIWLPLQERFITMYLDNILWDFDSYNVDYKWIFLHIDDESIYIEVNKNFDYDNQSEETYIAILNALIDIK